MTLINFLGYLGVGVNIVCCVPQVIKVAREGHAEGMALGYIALALFALTDLFVYVLMSGGPKQLLINYFLIAVMFSIILWYKLKPRKK